MTKKANIDEILESRIIDLLVRALNQIKAAQKVAPQESLAFSCQSIDNVLGSLAILNKKETRNHGRKLQVFGDVYVKDGTFPRNKAKALRRIMALWKSSRYEKGKVDPITLKQANEAYEIAELLLDFAIVQIAQNKGLSQSEIFGRIDFIARNVYFQDTYPWKAEHIPRTVEYKAFDFLERIKKRCISNQLYFEEDVGGFSGLTRIAYLGVPAADEMTEFEEEIYWMIALRLQDCFNDFVGLRNQIKFRMATGTEAHDHDLRWILLFNFLIKSLYLAIEDDVGITGLLGLAKKWSEIIIRIRIACGVSKLTKRKGQPIVENVGVRFALVESKIKEWLSNHPNYDQFNEQDRLLQEISFRRGWQFKDLPNEHDIALLAIASPRVIGEYALRPENLIRDFWSDTDGNEFSSEKIKTILELEKEGIDPYEAQIEEGLEFGQICHGLKDLAYWLARFDISDIDQKRLTNWEWLQERIGKKGIKELFALISKEKKELARQRKRIRRMFQKKASKGGKKNDQKRNKKES